MEKITKICTRFNIMEVRDMEEINLKKAIMEEKYGKT